MRKAVPVFIVLMGVWFIFKGLGLGIHMVSPPDKKLQIHNEQMHGAGNSANLNGIIFNDFSYQFIES